MSPGHSNLSSIASLYIGRGISGLLVIFFSFCLRGWGGEGGGDATDPGPDSVPVYSSHLCRFHNSGIQGQGQQSLDRPGTGVSCLA